MAAILALPGALSGQGACPAPTLTTIEVDGVLDDWAGVLANPGNVTVDGDGSSVGCLSSTDRDCAIADPSLDLHRFAWTHDDGGVSFFFERYAGSDTASAFFVLLDLDRDGLMTDGVDRAVLLELAPGSPTVGVAIYTYQPENPEGDPLVDAAGFADGHDVFTGATVQGVPRGQPIPLPGATADGERFETRVAWSDLDLAGPVVFDFHVGTLCCAEPLPVDNAGGPDGRVGTTGFRSLAVESPGSSAFGPNDRVLHPHRVVNGGTLAESWRMSTVSSGGHEVRLFSDPDGDGDPIDGALLAVDAKGDGDYAGPGDSVPGDVDGDTWPETGLLAPGEGLDLVLEVVPPNGTRRFQETTRLELSALGALCEGVVEDATSYGEITLTPRWDVFVEPGVQLDLPLLLANHSDAPTCVDLSWTSALGWNYVPYTDPDGDGDPSDGTWLTDACGGPGADLFLQPGQTVPFVHRALVPDLAGVGDLESLVMEGDSDLGGNVTTSVGHSLEIAELFTLEPSYRVVDGTARTGSAGRSILLAHTLRHAGPVPTELTLTATVDAPQAVTLYTDPNGDGLPTDGQPFASGDRVGPLAPNGGTFDFVVVVDIDADTPHDTVLGIDLAATMEITGSPRRELRDEVIVSRVAGYADPAHMVPQNLFGGCSVVFALANGLVPGQSGRYRIRWVEITSGTTIRNSPLTSDGAGEATAILDLSSIGGTGTYGMYLEEWDGIQWNELDMFEFEVSGTWSFRQTLTDRPWYALADELIDATVQFENTGPAPLQDVLLGVLVLDPSRTLYLRGDGTFVPHSPGLWTRSSGPYRMNPGESRTYRTTLPVLSFPVEGEYIMRAAALDACGAVLETSEVGFAASDDRDGDGWLDAEEEALGTDPLDRDSDDDGLLDPLDGAGDADGDGLIDALDCDADDDGLLDGLEAGLTAADLDAHTDLGSGCFAADADAGATVTSPRRADTDGGGLVDGAEDLDADGIVDPGERDPAEPLDDPCLAEEPAEVLDLRLVRRAGDLALRWDPVQDAGPCTTYTVVEATPAAGGGAVGGFAEVLADLDAPEATIALSQTPSRLALYMVGAVERIAGAGPLGHSLTD